MDTYEDNMDTDNGAAKATRYTVFVGNLDRRTTATEVRREFEAKGFKIDSLGA
jgi:RNA recognition motif-containing protein